MDELYKVILVDDEDDVRGRVASKITENSGFEVIGKAGNGYDALELIEQLNPDVVITDIKMPFINGIELARILRRDYPTIKLGFISGYDEFDYAREAIELNVMSYIMKPITNEDMSAFLTKLKKTLDDERDQIKNISNLNKLYDDSIPRLLQSNLYSFSYKASLDENDLKTLGLLNVNTKLSHYFVATIGFNQNEISHNDVLSIRKIIDRSFDSHDVIISFENNEGLSFIIGKEIEFNLEENDLTLFEVQSYIKEYIHITPTIGVSNLFNDFKQFPSAFKESVETKNFGRYYNLGTIVYYGDILGKEMVNMVIDDSLYDEFENVIKFSSIDELDTLLNTFREKLTYKEGYIVNHELFLVNIASKLISFAKLSVEDTSEIFSENLLQKLSSFTEEKMLFDWIKDIVIKIRAKNSMKQIDKVEKLVLDTFSIIDKNYMDSQLSLEGVASKLNISVSYLSSIIKKYKNITFNKYLIKVRMEKAKELLKYSDKKIINISKEVGYNEVYYFSHSFKKYTSLTPKGYREENKDS